MKPETENSKQGTSSASRRLIRLRRSTTSRIAILLLLFTTSSTAIFAQSVVTWNFDQQVGDVKSFTKIDKCQNDPDNSFLIKFENTSTQDGYHVNYAFAVKDDPTFAPIMGTLDLAPGMIQEGNCQSVLFTGLKLPCTSPMVTKLNQLSVTFTITKL